MKKVLVILSCLLLLVGCSAEDPVVEKLRSQLVTIYDGSVAFEVGQVNQTSLVEYYQSLASELTIVIGRNPPAEYLSGLLAQQTIANELVRLFSKKVEDEKAVAYYIRQQEADANEQRLLLYLYKLPVETRGKIDAATIEVANVLTEKFADGERYYLVKNYLLVYDYDFTGNIQKIKPFII